MATELQASLRSAAAQKAEIDADLTVARTEAIIRLRPPYTAMQRAAQTGDFAAFQTAKEQYAQAFAMEQAKHQAVKIKAQNRINAIDNDVKNRISEAETKVQAQPPTTAVGNGLNTAAAETVGRVTTVGNAVQDGAQGQFAASTVARNGGILNQEETGNEQEPGEGAREASTASNNEEFKSAFAKNIDGTLAEQGITLDKFNSLRLKDVAALSDTEKATLKAVRESIPMPDQNTVMQKAIPAEDIQKYLIGTYTQVSGYVAKAEDVSHLKTYEDIYNSLRLDYPNSAYNPKTDSSFGIIRFKTPETSQMVIPYSPEMGGTTKATQPFTGNGFIKSINGQIIPEFKANNYMTLTDGSELYEVTSNGTWKLEAVYDADLKRFIAVF